MRGPEANHLGEAEGIVALSAQILEGAKTQAEAILDEANLSAEHKVRELAEEAGHNAEVLVEKAERESEIEERRRITSAELEAKRVVLNKREELLNHAFEMAEDRLRNVNDLDVLKRLISEAVIGLGGGDLIVQANERDRKLLPPTILAQIAGDVSARNKLVTKLRLAAEAVPILGGVIVTSADRRRVFDNSFEERLRSARESLRGEVYRVLVGQP